MSIAPLHVAIIDDIAEDREILRGALLKGLERRVIFHEAETGEAALELWRSADGRLAQGADAVRAQALDLLLLDLKLPDMEGVEIIQAIKGKANILPVPVVVLTGMPRAEEARNALLAGAQDFIAKAQVTPENLARAVLNALERFQLLQQLDASEERAQQQFAELQAIYATAPIGLVVLDCNLRFVRVNQYLSGLFQHAPDDYARRTLRDMLPAVANELELPLLKVLATGKPLLEHEIKVNLPAQHTGQDTFLINFYPLHGAHGQIVGLNGVFQKITERKCLEEELKALNASLEERVAARTKELIQRNQDLDQFAYIASHDLKSPLRGITNLANWVLQDAGHLLPERAQGYLTRLLGRVERMENLLQDLLAYSRAGRFQYAAERVDAAVLVANLLKLLNPPPTFTIELQEPMPILVTQRVPLEIVLRNLIDNAIKHHNRQDGRVTISAAEDNGIPEFWVKDDGPGIAPQYHERVFQIFQTLQPRDTVEGSGMGLAIVKKTVECRGGVVNLISNEGNGVAFRFTWPT